MKFVKVYITTEIQERQSYKREWTFGIVLGSKKTSSKDLLIVKPIEEDLNPDEHDLLYRDLTEVEFTGIPTIHKSYKEE